MKALIIAVLSLALFSCRPSHSTSTAADSTAPSTETSKGSANISASPNPILPGGELGETMIAWSTGSDKSGEVYVSKEGGAEKRFAAGENGSHKVKWIQAGKRYEFLLYEGSAHSKVLARVQVLHRS